MLPAALQRVTLAKSIPYSRTAAPRPRAHRLVAAIDPHQEERLGDEQADAEVLVDGVPVALEASEEAEGEEADEEADQRQQDADPRDDVQEHVVNGILVLEERRESKQALLRLERFHPTSDIPLRRQPQVADPRHELVRANQSKTASCRFILDGQQSETWQTVGRAAGVPDRHAGKTIKAQQGQ